MVFYGEGNPPRELKAPFVLLRAHTYRKGEQKRQSADLIFLLPLESVLAARECIEIQSHKDAARKERFHAGFAPTANPRAKFSRTCTT